MVAQPTPQPTPSGPTRARFLGARGALVGYSRGFRFRGWSGFGWQVALLVPPALLYFVVRDLSADQEREAFRNAASIVDLQKALGLDWEATIQARVLGTDWLITVMNWVYIWGHFPLITAALVLLFGLSRREFLTLRNALVASGALGLVCFAIYPVAPPRLFDPTLFFDSLGELSSSYHFLQNPKVTNQFAAVPSFHVGWNLLVATAIWRATSRRSIRFVVAVFPLLMMSAVVLTANHWLLDIAAGISVALVGLGGAALMDRAFSRLSPLSAANRPTPERAPLIAFEDDPRQLSPSVSR